MEMEHHHHHHPATGSASAAAPLPEKGPVGRDVERESLADSEVSVQEGVKRIEAVSMTWTTWGLGFAYLGIFLLAFSTSLNSQVFYSLSVIATSSFDNHSLISTVTVVQQIVNAVVKPPMAKVADVFGRTEAFAFSVLLFVLGMIQMATSSNVETYASAQIFYSAGGTGLQILQQIFIADTSDLLNRALWSSLPDIPFLVTVWIGPLITTDLMDQWRWGFGLWAIVLPVAFLPLAVSLWSNQRKASRMGLLPASPYRGMGVLQTVKTIFFELDTVGIILLSAAFSLILLPLTLTQATASGWQSASIIAMIVVGGVCLILFPLWEISKRLAPYPLIPMHLLRSRTFCAGCGIGFFYFMVFYLSVYPYFYSYLLVVQNQSIVAAGHITQTFSFTSTVAAILVSFCIKYTRHYKYWVMLGALIYLMGIGLMIRYRTEDATVGNLVGTQIAVGIGGGMLNVPAQLAVQAAVPHQNVAAATAVYLTIVEIGGAVGAAISGAIWSRNILPKLIAYLPASETANAEAIYGSVYTATAYAVGSPAREAINRAYQETLDILLIVAICMCVPIVLLTLLLKNIKLDDANQHVKGRVIGGQVVGREGSREQKTPGLVGKLRGMVTGRRDARLA